MVAVQDCDCAVRLSRIRHSTKAKPRNWPVWRCFTWLTRSTLPYGSRVTRIPTMAFGASLLDNPQPALPASYQNRSLSASWSCREDVADW